MCACFKMHVVASGFTLQIKKITSQIFSLSLKASSQTELDSWVCAIHSACAGSFARQHGKDNIVRLLRSELHKLETNIDIVSMVCSQTWGHIVPLS